MPNRSTGTDELGIAETAGGAGLKLNLGCGHKRKPGFLGVDRFPTEAVDRLADLEGDLPFADGSVDEVWMDNVIEHVRDIPRLMREIHRVCRAEARITIRTPHFSSGASWRDPTHVHHLSYFSMDHLAKDAAQHYAGAGFRVVRRRLGFVGGPMGLVARLLFFLSPRQYENTWCFLFRASTLTFELAVVKSA